VLSHCPNVSPGAHCRPGAFSDVLALTVVLVINENLSIIFLMQNSHFQNKPVLTIEPGAGYLFSTHWSPVRPLVLAMATEDGHLVIYDLKTSHVTPLYKLEAGSKKTPLYTLQFNAHQ
jgi:hypothetical protein